MTLSAPRSSQVPPSSSRYVTLRVSSGVRSVAPSTTMDTPASVSGVRDPRRSNSSNVTPPAPTDVADPCCCCCCRRSRSELSEPSSRATVVDAAGGTAVASMTDIFADDHRHETTIRCAGDGRQNIIYANNNVLLYNCIIIIVIIAV